MKALRWLAPVLAAIALAGMLSTTHAQTPTPAGTPFPPKPTVTATAAPPAAPPAATKATVAPAAPAKAPAPAKTGSAGLHAGDARIAAEGLPGGAVGGTLAIGALITAVVTLVKMAWPGSLPSRVTLAVVLVVAAGAMALQAASGLLTGLTPYEAVAQWVALSLTSIGWREGTTAVAPGLSALPTNPGPLPPLVGGVNTGPPNP